MMASTDESREYEVHHAQVMELLACIKELLDDLQEIERPRSQEGRGQ